MVGLTQTYVHNYAKYWCVITAHKTYVTVNMNHCSVCAWLKPICT